MTIQMADMCAYADIVCSTIEPKPDYVDSLQPTLKRPEYWNNLRSSKNRTKIQEEDSRWLIEEQIDRSEVDIVFVLQMALVVEILGHVEQELVCIYQIRRSV